MSDGERQGVRDLLQRLGQEASPETLAQTIQEIGALGRASEARCVLPFLAHGDPRVVARSVEALARLDPQGVFEVLLPLVGHADARVQAAATKACHGLDPRRTLTFLRQMLHADTSSLRTGAAHCVSLLDRPVATSVLVEALAREPDANVAREIARYLGACADESSLLDLARLSQELPAPLAASAREAMELVGARVGLGADELDARVACLRKKARVEAARQAFDDARSSGATRRSSGGSQSRIQRPRRPNVLQALGSLAARRLQAHGPAIFLAVGLAVFFAFGAYSVWQRIDEGGPGLLGDDRPAQGSGDERILTVEGTVEAVHRRGFVVKAGNRYFVVVGEENIKRLQPRKGERFRAVGAFIGWWNPPGVTVLSAKEVHRGAVSGTESGGR